MKTIGSPYSQECQDWRLDVKEKSRLESLPVEPLARFFGLTHEQLRLALLSQNYAVLSAIKRIADKEIRTRDRRRPEDYSI